MIKRPEIFFKDVQTKYLRRYTHTRGKTFQEGSFHIDDMLFLILFEYY